MKKIYLVLIILALIIVLIGIIYLLKIKSSPTTQNLNLQSAVPIVHSSVTAELTKTSTFNYPINQYNERLTKNSFGSFYPSNSPQTLDSNVCPGATEYSGYHTGDDLETFANEKDSAVSVYSIYKGTVLKVQKVSGYGGIIVISYNINGQDYTAYFGHIDLSTALVKSGNHVNAGDKLAELAPSCSSANDNVRKHLHFAIHRGSQIDYKGYVATKSALGAWVDPKSYLESLISK